MIEGNLSCLMCLFGRNPRPSPPCLCLLPWGNFIRRCITSTNFQLGTVSRINSKRTERAVSKGQRNRDLLDPQPEPATNPFKKVGRNDPCPCGSGKNTRSAAYTSGRRRRHTALLRNTSGSRRKCPWPMVAPIGRLSLLKLPKAARRGSEEEM